MMRLNVRTGTSRNAVSALILLSATLAVGAAPLHRASAHTFKVIYSFCSEAQCTDGLESHAALVADGEGNLFGTTKRGGDAEMGVVFELIPNAARTRWQYKTLHSFCSGTCADGSEPLAGVIVDAQGNVYGTTSGGGMSDRGTVFKLSPRSGRREWKFKLLHAFCPNGAEGCTDGQYPFAGLTYAGQASGVRYDGTSSLYGVTTSGGTHLNSAGFGEGTMFELRPNGTRWKERVLYDFCNNDDCALKIPRPNSALTMDAAGNLYGTGDDERDFSAVYKLSLKRPGTGWTGQLLYTFCSLANCADGGGPGSDRLLLDGNGNLYGTTTFGGAHASGNNPGGTVYRLNPGTGSLATLYDFCALADCADGKYAVAGLVMDETGVLYGAASEGGDRSGFSEGGGTLFSVTQSGLTTLRKFCAKPACSDGNAPIASLLAVQGNTYFGTNSDGGAHGGGVVFALTP